MFAFAAVQVYAVVLTQRVDSVLTRVKMQKPLEWIAHYVLPRTCISFFVVHRLGFPANG